MPSEDFLLRPIAADEGALAANIVAAAWPVELSASAAAEIQRLPASFRAAGGEFWLAEYRQVAIGAIGAAPAGKGDWDVRWLCLLPRWRRMGLGTLLLRRIEALVAERGGRRLLCSPPTEAARLFLRAVDFVEWEADGQGRMARDLTSC